MEQKRTFQLKLKLFAKNMNGIILPGVRKLRKLIVNFLFTNISYCCGMPDIFSWLISSNDVTCINGMLLYYANKAERKYKDCNKDNR